jgi:biopolymer transport protein ExbB/TolQ
MQPISDSLIQFATNIAQVAPKIVPALILVGIGLLIGKVIDLIARKIAEKMKTASSICQLIS